MSNKPKKMKDLPLEEQEALAARYDVRAVIDQTGHPPEQYPTPQRRITGSEAPSTYQVQPYRAPLFPTEEVGQP